MDSLKLNLVQKAAFSLIQQDLQYIYTVIKYIKPHESNYIPSMLPYLGVVIDGAEDWVKAINNSSKCKLQIPLFKESESVFYEQIRNSIKMWNQDYDKIYKLLKMPIIKAMSILEVSAIQLLKRFISMIFMGWIL